MMTHDPESANLPVFSSQWIVGCIVAAAVFAVLARAICSSAAFTQVLPPQAGAAVHQIGDSLMHRYVLPLEIMGLLLTAALIGAVVIAMDRKEEMK
jgi:NADH-quinone oxidoreductase subunit J